MLKMISCFFLIFLFQALNGCEVFIGSSCSCYESIDIRCSMSKSSEIFLNRSSNLKKFQSIDLKFSNEEMIVLSEEHFVVLNEILESRNDLSLSITLRFENFQSFRAQSRSFKNIFRSISRAYSRLVVEFQPLRSKSVVLESNVFEDLEIDELSIYGDSFSLPFESIFNLTKLTHLNIEGATIPHDPTLVEHFQGQVQSLKLTRMIENVNSDEFPPFPVRSLTIEAHKIRRFNARSFSNYEQLSGLNLIQPDVPIDKVLFDGLENLKSLRSVSLDAERIVDGALKHVKQIDTLILGSFLKIIDGESLNSLSSLRQLDVRYVQFSNLLSNSSCLLGEFISRRVNIDLNVYLPIENIDCDCVLSFLNSMIVGTDQANKCQSTHNDRCLFSSCPTVAQYFGHQTEKSQSIASSSSPKFEDLPFYDDSTTIQISMEANIYDNEDEEQIPLIPDSSTTSTTPVQFELFINEISTEQIRLKSNQQHNYLIVSWIPFAIIASCLFLALVIAMVSFIICNRRRTVSFKLVPQNLPMI